ncbi:MAG: tRNA (adenosine(37)-N6)-threonylcarbamoyltransferase complex transferase subunit TsaD [Clostridiales bacterium]|nr:tRNA (adenosine(37)-N6)-threonylcarbamoyltransferase complex transferase subunit TsaD [Clostridiales bacterium]
MGKDVFILGIKSSCDETACSVVRNGREIVSNIIASQADFHEQYGGVVPEIASRMHVDAVYPCIENALKEAGMALSDIDAVAVTYGPGLVGALLVGLSAAKGLCAASGKPLVGVNHLHGHICANYLAFPELEPPFLCLCVSGGNTAIVHVKDYLDLEVLGKTRDDAAGEAIDKISRVIGLGYPGGPKMDKAGQGGDIHAYTFSKTHMGDTLDFSFSGIKTSALNLINGMRQKGEEPVLKDFAASYQQHLSDILLENTLKAAQKTGIKTICLAGGVSANSFLRKSFDGASKKHGLKLCYPPLGLCTDNGAMIASAGYYDYINGMRDSLDINAKPSLKLGVNNACG